MQHKGERFTVLVHAHSGSSFCGVSALTQLSLQNKF